MRVWAQAYNTKDMRPCTCEAGCKETLCPKHLKHFADCVCPSTDDPMMDYETHDGKTFASPKIKVATLASVAVIRPAKEKPSKKTRKKK